MATDEQTELQPCAICARTFKPQSLEKHTRICELAAMKKRKPFDSAKQRIKGTELAEFVPMETTMRKIYQPEERNVNVTCNKGTWKQTHDEFLRAIRAARGETIEETPQRQTKASSNLVTVGVPTRPNEKGMCPTCNRKFSIKSYERHVAWCKERSTRVPMSAATNIAKERLEARMKYRAPALKNRRLTTREKYSPMSAINLTSLASKGNNGNLSNQRACKETASTPNCNKKTGNDNATAGNSQSQRTTLNTRRTGQSREGTSSGPMKSRLSDRSSRPSGENDSSTTPDCPSPRQNNSSRISDKSFVRQSRCSPTNYPKSAITGAQNFRTREISCDIIDENDEITMKNRRSRRNIVQARSHGNPRVNDTTINDDVIGMTVMPCVGKLIFENTDELVTWKKIGEKNLRKNASLNMNAIGNEFISGKSVDNDRRNLIENTFDDDDDDDDDDDERVKNITWIDGIEKLNQTYLIRESLDDEINFNDFDDDKKRTTIDDTRDDFHDEKVTRNRHYNGHYDDSLPLLNFEKKVKNEKFFGDNSHESTRRSLSRFPRLEPLNLSNIENDENPKCSITSRSQRSAKSSGKIRENRIERNMEKLIPIFRDESSSLESHDFPSIVEKNHRAASRNEKFYENFHEKMENIHITDDSRMKKSRKIRNNDLEVFATRKIDETIGNARIDDESSNFVTGYEKNREKRFSDCDNLTNGNNEDSRVTETPRSSGSKKSARSEKLLERKIEEIRSIAEKDSIGDDSRLGNDEISIFFETSSSSKGTVTSSNNREVLSTKNIAKIDSTEASDFSHNEPLNFPSHESNENSTEKFSFEEIDVKIVKDESASRLDNSRSLNGVSSSNDYNDLSTKKMAEICGIVENFNYDYSDEKNLEISKINDPSRCVDAKIVNEENTRDESEFSIAKSPYESTNGKFFETKNLENSSFRVIHDRRTPNRNETENTSVILANKFDDICEKSGEFSVEKNNGKFEKSTENESGARLKIKNAVKMNYQRCGTYVIDKKLNFNTDAKHQAPDEFFDDKPLRKRRKTKNNETKKDSKTFHDPIDDRLAIEKSIPADRKENEHVTSIDENMIDDRQKSMENHEITKDRRIVKNEVRELSEKYVNEKFNCDSNETLTNDNFLNDHNEPDENNTKINEKLIFPGSALNYDFHEKSFSDSQVTRENFSHDNTFLENSKVENFSAKKRRSGEKNSHNIDSSRFPDKPEVARSTEMARKIDDETLPEVNFSGKPEILSVENSNVMRRSSGGKNFLEIEDILEKPEVEISIEIRRRLREKMKILRGSTNNLIASVETSGSVKNGENSSRNVSSYEIKSTGEIEEETIREIDFGKIGKTIDDKTSFCGFLPEIPIDRINGKNDNAKNERKIISPEDVSFYWQKGMKNLNPRLINLDPPKFHRETKIPFPRLTNLPPVVPFGKEKQSGIRADYDPFVIAERQMNDLLSDTCSEKSLTDSPSNRRGTSASSSLPNYPLSHSSAFVKYPDNATSKNPKITDKRVSLIAPPMQFDDLTSDSTETNSVTRETNDLDDINSPSRDAACREKERRNNVTRMNHVPGRRLIIDKYQALGTNETYDDTASLISSFQSSPSNGKVRKFFEKTTTKVGRSNSVNSGSIAKLDERKSPSSGIFSSNKVNTIRNGRNNNYASLSGSNLSLSSIVSSETDVKRSNSLFDELASSYEDDASGVYASLSCSLKNDSLSVDSPPRTNRPRNSGQISDEEFSSPDSYKRQKEHSKLSADSAYSSLNRKYSNHGRSTNDMAGRHDEDSPLRRREADNVKAITRSKMSKFCHECGSKFPDTAKFCCECGIRRLAL